MAAFTCVALAACVSVEAAILAIPVAVLSTASTIERSESPTFSERFAPLHHAPGRHHLLQPLLFLLRLFGCGNQFPV